MAENYNPKEKKPKVKISVSIDAVLDDMVKDAIKEYGVNYSTAVNDMLIYFKKEFLELLGNSNEFNKYKDGFLQGKISLVTWDRYWKDKKQEVGKQEIELPGKGIKISDFANELVVRLSDRKEIIL